MSLIKYIKKLIFRDKKPPSYEELHISGIYVNNDIVAQNDVLVTKSVTANIYCAKSIIICSDSEVIGDIYCKGCTLEGKVRGNISASELIEIKANAALNGNIIAKNLKVDPAAILNGTVAIIKVKEAERINREIKLKINQVGQLDIKINSPALQIQNADPTPAKVDGLGPEVVAVDIQTPKEKEVNKELDNGKWW